MKVEQLARAQVLEINAYQLSKRQGSDEGARAVGRRELAALIEKHLTWTTLEPGYLKQYSSSLSSTEARRLDAFFQTDAGRHYVDGFLTAAASIAIALDQFVDTMVDRVVDEPDLPLERVEKLTPDEATAAELLHQFRSPETRAAFAEQRKALLTAMATLTRPKTKSQQALDLQAKRLEEIGIAFSEEQIVWRSARVLSHKLPATHVKEMLAAMSDSELVTALQNLNATSEGAQSVALGALMNNDEVKAWFAKQFANAK
jgi:hypothetical protein